jgi:hypothetical protein
MLLPTVRWDARKTGGGPCCQVRTTELPGQDDGVARSTPMVLLGARWCCCKVSWRGYHIAAVLLPAWWCGATGVVAQRCSHGTAVLPELVYAVGGTTSRGSGAAGAAARAAWGGVVVLLPELTRCWWCCILDSMSSRRRCF